MPLRIPTRFSEDIERIATEIVDGAMQVHRHLGPGLREGVYHDAMAIELEYRQLRFDREKRVMLRYRDKPLRTHKLDLVVEDKVLVELKAVARIEPVHVAQTIGYLKASELQLGLLINFNADWLKGNIRRIVV